MNEKMVRVVRAFLYKGERVAPSDKPIKLPKLLALELEAAKKVEFVDEQPAPPVAETPSADAGSQEPAEETSGDASASEPAKGKGKGSRDAK